MVLTPTLPPERTVNFVLTSNKPAGPVVPIPTLPPTKTKVFAEVLALTERAVLAPTRRPFEISILPENDVEPVPENVLIPLVKKLPDILATPPNEAVPRVSRSPLINKSLLAEM